MRRWLLGEHLKKAPYGGEEVQHRGAFPARPLSIAHSAGWTCTLLPPPSRPSRWVQSERAEREACTSPHLAKSARRTEQEKCNTQHEETLTEHWCVLEKASEVTVPREHQPDLACSYSDQAPLKMHLCR